VGEDVVVGVGRLSPGATDAGADVDAGGQVAGRHRVGTGGEDVQVRLGVDTGRVGLGEGEHLVAGRHEADERDRSALREGNVETGGFVDHVEDATQPLATSCHFFLLFSGGRLRPPGVAGGGEAKALPRVDHQARASSVTKGDSVEPPLRGVSALWSHGRPSRRSTNLKEVSPFWNRKCSEELTVIAWRSPTR